MRKFAYFLIFIGILLIVVPLILINQGILKVDNNDNKEIVEKEYNYVSYNDLTENNKVNVLSRLYSKSGTSESTKLKLNTQTYNLYELFDQNEIYKIEVNKNKDLLTTNLNKLKEIDFYIINSKYYIIKLNFSYSKETIPTYKEDSIIEKDDWTFYFDEEDLTMFGYYKLTNGTFMVKIGDGNLKGNKELQNKLIDIVINNLKITKENSSELYTTSYNNSITSFIELSREDSIYEIDKNNILDLSTNYYITKWSIADNWSSNEINLVSKDYSNTLLIRESLNEYSLDTIKVILKTNTIEEFDYKEEKVNTINESNTNRLQGYIKKINNRSYTILYNLNNSNILNITNNDKNSFIEFTEKNLYKTDVNGG